MAKALAINVLYVHRPVVVAKDLTAIKLIGAFCDFPPSRRGKGRRRPIHLDPIARSAAPTGNWTRMQSGAYRSPDDSRVLAMGNSVSSTMPISQPTNTSTVTHQRRGWLHNVNVSGPDQTDVALACPTPCSSKSGEYSQDRPEMGAVAAHNLLIASPVQPSAALGVSHPPQDPAKLEVDEYDQEKVILAPQTVRTGIFCCIAIG